MQSHNFPIHTPPFLSFSFLFFPFLPPIHIS